MTRDEVLGFARVREHDEALSQLLVSSSLGDLSGFPLAHLCRHRASFRSVWTLYTLPARGVREPTPPAMHDSRFGPAGDT